jgi:molybdopterin molybdotransferase
MHIQGATYKPALRIPVPVGFDRNSQMRDEFVRVELHDGVAMRMASQSSGVLSSALYADGLLHLPSDMEIKQGQQFDFIPFCALL